MRLLFSAVVFASFAAGCGTNDAVDYIAGFDPPSVPDGFTRYVTAPVQNITPGANTEMCQWVAPAADSDQDVLGFMGQQSPTGHHVVLYATTETNFKVGESHVCTNDDMISISFIGALGGEGIEGTNSTSADDLPTGLFFRLPKGKALMANTHWLNATDKTVEGQAVLDVKFGPADESHTIADIFANNGDTFSLSPMSPTAYDVSCTFKQDMNVAMAANHMHADGTSIYTEIVRAADGTKDMLVQDMQWAAEQAFNPNFVQWTEAAPMVIHAGDTIHTHCEWDNTTASTVLFPDEMCVGTGFYFPSQGQQVCSDGSWD